MITIVTTQWSLASVPRDYEKRESEIELLHFFICLIAWTNWTRNYTRLVYAILSRLSFFHMHIYRRSELPNLIYSPLEKISQTAISYHLTPNDRRFGAFNAIFCSFFPSISASPRLRVFCINLRFKAADCDCCLIVTSVAWEIASKI